MTSGAQFEFLGSLSPPYGPIGDIGAKSFKMLASSHFCELEGVEGNLEHRQPGSFGRTTWLKKIFWKNFFEIFWGLVPLWPHRKIF